MRGVQSLQNVWSTKLTTKLSGGLGERYVTGLSVTVTNLGSGLFEVQ